VTTLAAVINTLNESRNIDACIESVRPYVDEIIVCDQFSDDDTQDRARALGATVVTYPRVAGNFVGAPKKFAIEAATSEYVVSVDADERFTSALGQRLRQLAEENAHAVIFFRKRNFYFGGFLQHAKPFFVPEPLMFRKSAYLSTYSHAVERHHNNYAGVRTATPSIVLDRSLYIDHYAYPTIEKYVTKTVGWYARAEAVQAFKEGTRFRLAPMILDPLRFFAATLVKGGWRDGVRGLIAITLFSAYLFAKHANLWLIERSPREFDMDDDRSDLVWSGSPGAAPLGRTGLDPTA
jgi:(heptosyl)LPS beta-1,4-glucosyltransferase